MSKKLDLSHLATDKLAFIEKLCRMPDGRLVVPHPTQREFLTHITRNTVLLAGRQWGKSTCLGWDGAWYATTHRARQIYCIAPSLDQARIIWNEIAFQFRQPPLSVLVEKLVEYPFPYLKLSNGTEIHARGANSPQFLRGKHAHRVITDESAFIKDETHENVIEPMMTVTGNEDEYPDSAKIDTSTPFGQGYFYDTYQMGQNHEESYSSFTYTSEQNPHADKKHLERVKKRYGEDSLLWRTEYLAQFADSDLAVFPWQDIQWAYEHFPTEHEAWVGKEELRRPATFPMAPVNGHIYTQGVDLANQRDYFVSTVLDVTNPTLALLARMDRLQKRGYAFYKGLIQSNYNAYGHAETIIDATTLAESVVEDLHELGVEVEGYKFGGSSAKHEVVLELARMLAEHRLAIPYDHDIIDELRFFEYKITPSKALKVEASRGHDDIVMSLALNAHLASRPRTTGFFMPTEVGVAVAAPAHAAKQRTTWADLFNSGE